MELKSLTSYKSAFALTRLILVVLIIGFCITVLGGYLLVQKTINEIQNKMIVIDTRGVIYPSGQIDYNQMRIYEYQNHARILYNMWYAFDENSYAQNIEKGLQLLGECGIEMLDVYKEQNLERLLFERNMRFEVEIEELKIDMNTIPISGYIKGKQTIIRGHSKLTRHLDCEFTVHDVSRSELNPHGVKIDNWEIINTELVN